MSEGFGLSKKLLGIEVKGKTKTWGFNFYGDPKHLQEWLNDGLDVYEILNIVPEWVVDYGLSKPWIFFQDLFNFKNPFSG